MRYLLLLGLVAFSAASDLKKDVPCVCPLIWKPVCGNDGHTYPNECILNCVKLALRPDLEVAHQGACSHLPLAAQEEEVVGLNLLCGCPYFWQPVCGNDGRTYPNKCEFNCAKRGKPELELAYVGTCKHRLLAAQAEEVEELGGNPCECPRALHRVCGSDGNTYSNPCMLNCAKHEGNPNLKQVHEGRCDEHDHDFEDPCKCDNKFEPVCGNDGITYPNLCHLDCATFTTSPGVEVAYKGECHAEIENFLQKLIQGNHCECPRALHRICGSDGNTYSNPCMLNCAIHEGYPNLKQVHEGPCDEHDHDFEDPCKCDNTYEPVCGNDGITYPNLCELECATITGNPGVEVAYEGECHAEIENFLQKLIQGDPCECPRALHRVCGSNGNTYSNPCMLNCARQAGNPNLKQVHEGPCDEHDHDFEDPCKCDNTDEPVCGNDGITYPNLCHLDCAAFTTSPGVEVENKGECHAVIQENQQILKSCICTKIYKPVCGTDGLTYPNLCILKCHVADNPGLEVKHEGKCHEEIQENHQILQSCICTKIYKPVCGTDGMTYSNLCVLNCHPRVQLAHVGNCETNQQAVETEEVRNPCICFRNFVPMCGTDGKTYGNLCMLNCAAETKVPGLKLLHKGRCAPKDVEKGPN